MDRIESIFNKNVLVSGANGVIGSFSYNDLKNNFLRSTMSYNQGLIQDDFPQIDLTNEPDVKSFADKCIQFDALIFLVGLAHKKGKEKDIDKFRKVNTQTLVNLLSDLEYENKVPAQIIFASTISVYGEKYNQKVYHEDSEKKPFSSYAIAKLEAEQYLLVQEQRKSGLKRRLMLKDLKI